MKSRFRLKTSLYTAQQNNAVNQPQQQQNVVFQPNYRSDDNDVSPAAVMVAVPAVGAAGLGTHRLYKNWLGKSAKAAKDAIDSHNNETLGNLKVGDVLSKDKGGYTHWGVVTGLDKDGKPIITHYTRKHDTGVVRSQGFNEFADGHKVSIEGHSSYSEKKLQRRAKKFLDQGFGGYSLTNNNCEHFANRLAYGKNVSHQVDNALESRVGKVGSWLVKRVFRKNKNFSAIPQAVNLLNGQKQHLIADNLFGIRKHLSKDLGGLSHFNKNQTLYLSGAGSIIGGLAGRDSAERQAKRDAILKYGLRPGTLEYDNYINSKKNEGLLKGAAKGGAVGFGASKAVDLIRGKVVSDKAKISEGIDLGNNYFNIGKGFRGIRSEGQIADIKKNISTVIQGGKDLTKLL